MTKLQRGDIITVNLNPTKGSETGKIRPCVVVTNNVYNQRVPVIQVVPITEWTEKKGRIVTNVIIEPNAANGLTKRSVADCLQTRPIDYRQVRYTNILYRIIETSFTLFKSQFEVKFRLPCLGKKQR